MSYHIRLSEKNITFDGTNVVKINTTPSMTGMLIESLEAPVADKPISIRVELEADVVYTITAGATAGDSAVASVTTLLTSGLFFIKSVIPATFTVATNVAKITLGNQATAGAFSPGDAIYITGEGTALEPLLYVQSVSGADVILGYSSAPAQAGVNVNVMVLGDTKKDKLIVDGKVTIAGSNSYFEASLPADFIADQINIVERDINGVKLVIDSSSTDVKFITITRVDTATGKYYFNSLGTNLKTGDIITGHIYFNPAFTIIPYGLFDRSIYNYVALPKDALPAGKALVTIKTASPI